MPIRGLYRVVRRRPAVRARPERRAAALAFAPVGFCQILFKEFQGTTFTTVQGTPMIFDPALNETLLGAL